MSHDTSLNNFLRRPGTAQVDTELRRWLRSLPVEQRVDFLRSLYGHNYRYAITLMRSSQLPLHQVVQLLQHWLLFSSHNCSRGLVAGFVPMIGEARFWTIAAKLDLNPTMADFLNYHGRGKLNHYRDVLSSRHPS
ncbi:hypothetical protein [Pseudoduganella chitinolytica]|uniref:Uncharacterized protein n=1 Tax=Pseudoduganella chitinolytica TaxID=34070 RepID=A0ABY8BKF5_9BURK|nr:hypothetical protein [Pseudoduganella chitinolytica]WEF35167.1 hypothetical protein PX653_10520 [Pseudoduganella chitinolytica]